MAAVLTGAGTCGSKPAPQMPRKPKPRPQKSVYAEEDSGNATICIQGFCRTARPQRGAPERTKFRLQEHATKLMVNGGRQPTMQEIDLPPIKPDVYEIPDRAADSKPRKILVLDDDPAFTETLKDALESRNYRLTIVPSGAEGVKQILAGDFDAIVCDMVMPNFPGDMFYLAVQRARPQLCKRFIFTTGHKDNPKIVQFIKQTGRITLWKPFEMRELVDALEFVTR